MEAVRKLQGRVIAAVAAVLVAASVIVSIGLASARPADAGTVSDDPVTFERTAEGAGQVELAPAPAPGRPGDEIEPRI